MSTPLDASEKRFERLRTLTEVSRALTYTTSIDEVLQLAVTRAADMVDADQALIMLTDADGLLSVRASHGVDEERVTAFREPLNETLIRRLQGLLDHPAKDSFLSVPLVAKGAVTGLLAAVRGSGEPATADDEWLLSALADQTAVALENSRLTDAVRTAEEARGRDSEAQGRARATLGHELRAPLTAIQAYTSLLLEGLQDPLTDRQRESISRIRMSGEHLLAIIENVLESTRINAGTVALAPEDFPIGQIITETFQMLQPLVAEKDQELVHGTGAGITVSADRHRLRQALVNLVGNAIKYTPREGTIRVEVTTRRRGDRELAAIAVRDDGPGIAPEAIANVFEPYERGGAGSSAAGLGLGLYISRELVRQMGGEIEAESEPGVGSTFTLLIPLAGGSSAEG